MKKKLVAAFTPFGSFGALFLAIITMIVVMLVAISTSDTENNTDINNLDGLPSFITQEMVIAALEEQEIHGYPAAVTIAQIVAESGYGRYGPGGETGQGLSKLAYDYKNLFGMKAPAGDSTPIGVINMQTGEEVGGDQITITAGFLVFKNYTDCIKYRSGLIQRVYSDLVQNITDPDMFALKIASRWATDHSYASKLIKIMQQYDLYRFSNISSDSITGSGDGSVSKGQKRIVEIALSLDSLGAEVNMCQKWVANVYFQAGQSPRQSRACATEAANAFLVSGSKENIPVGATVYGHSYKYNAKCGNHDAGHVGIYVGNGNVVSRENTVKLRTLQEWINVYGWKGWGWNGSQDFSKIN